MYLLYIHGKVGHFGDYLNSTYFYFLGTKNVAIKVQKGAGIWKEKTDFIEGPQLTSNVFLIPLT